MNSDEAAEALYAAPLKQFVEERKRLAAELRTAGDKAGAAAVAKLPRPGMSAWVVNQLWRQAQGEMGALFAAGAKLRSGDFGAGAPQRAALQRLRAKAAEILKSDGHAASEGTLHRVQTTLQALSAIGGFEPDAPGRLVEDRDPPGFEVLGGVTEVKKAPEEERPGTGTGTGTGMDQKEREQRREEERVRKQVDVELGRAMKVLERARHAVRIAEGEVAEQAERMARVEREAEKARKDLAEVESLVESIEKKR